MTTPATAAEVTGILGEVDPVVLERILEISASFDEVAEALSALEDEDTFGEVSHLPSSQKVEAVRAVLQELVLEDTGADDREREELPASE